MTQQQQEILNPLGTVFAITHVGMERKDNQDDFVIWETHAEEAFSFPTLGLFVADGMGGHRGGSVASHETVKEIQRQFLNPTEHTIPDQLAICTQAANHRVFQMAQEKDELHGMGTTCTGVIVTPDKLFFVHVGDSRCYKIIGNNITQITKDHLYVTELYEMGLITLEQARAHPNQHLLSRALGTHPTIKVDQEERSREPGTTLILCSDGLHNYLSPQEIGMICLQNTPQQAAQKLVQLANDRGGGDNITVIVARLGEAEIENSDSPTEITEIQVTEEIYSANNRKKIKTPLNTQSSLILFSISMVITMIILFLIVWFNWENIIN